MHHKELETVDRLVIIMQKATPGQCVSMVQFLLCSDKFDARMVGTPVEIQSSEQAVLFTM